MIHITIDGQPLDVPPGTTVLEATRMAGIEIPTLCDHPSLKPYGGCRLCVVEIEGARTLQASCTLPVYPNMVVRTDTPKVRKAREFVLTLLFSERNHFCMYCQKTAGDCELQNAAYGEGMTHWPLQPNWKPYLVDATNPYFVFDHNRCILCRRCVRACGDLAGNFTLNLENRGASSLVIADNGVPVGESTCVNCGTCVQVCPTGALIDRQSAYIGKETEAGHVKSVCVGCSVGCGIDILTHAGRVLRIDGDWEAPVNGGLLCELGRYGSLEDDRPRLTTPLVRKDGVQQPASWEEALQFLAGRIAPLRAQNGSGVAALASTRLSAEALYAFKELFAVGLHGSMVSGIEEDFTSAGEEALPSGKGLDALKNAGCVVVIGADLVKSHQVAGFFVKRNLPSGLCLISIDPAENEMADIANFYLQPKPGSDAELLQGIQASLVSLGLNKSDAPQEPCETALAEASRATGIPAETIVAVAREIGSAESVVFVFGKGLAQKSSTPALQALYTLAEMSGAAAVINLRGRANSLAAGCYGLDQAFNPQGYAAAYLALGDDLPSPRLVQQLEGIPFLAVQASHASALTEMADVVLPVAIWTEQGGHYLNLEGRLQKASQAVLAPAGARPNVAILEDLSGRLGVRLAGNWKDALSQPAPEPAGVA